MPSQLLGEDTQGGGACEHLKTSRHIHPEEGRHAGLFSFNTTVLDFVVFNLGPLDGRTFQNILAKIDPLFNAFGVSLK